MIAAPIEWRVAPSELYWFARIKPLRPGRIYFEFDTYNTSLGDLTPVGRARVDLLLARVCSRRVRGDRQSLRCGFTLWSAPVDLSSVLTRWVHDFAADRSNFKGADRNVPTRTIEANR